MNNAKLYNPNNNYFIAFLSSVFHIKNNRNLKFINKIFLQKIALITVVYLFFISGSVCGQTNWIDDFNSAPFSGAPTSFLTGSATIGLEYIFTSEGDGGDFAWGSSGGWNNSGTINVLSATYNSETVEKITIKSRDGNDFKFNSIYLDIVGDGITITGIGPEPFSISISSSTIGTHSPAGGSKLVSEIQLTSTDFNQDFIDNVNVTIYSNSAPEIHYLNGDSFNFSEGDGATTIDQGTALTITDSDYPTNLYGGNLTVTITSGEDAAEDILSLNTSGSVALAGTTAGSNVSVSSTVIGTLGNNIAPGNDLLVNFNSSSSLSNVQTLARAVTYQNSDITDPTTGVRNIRVTVNDGDGGTSSNNDVTITVYGINDEPTLSATGLNPTFIDGLGAQKLFSGANASTIESGQTLDQLILTITNILDGSDEILRIDKTDVALTDANSVITSANSMDVNISLAGGTATVTISKTGGISVSAMQTIIDSLAYKNTAANPSTNNRIATITSIRDNGNSSGSNDNLNDALSITSTLSITVVPKPSVQATNIIFSTVGVVFYDINWTNGNGSKRAVFIKEGSSGSAAPEDKTSYSANPIFHDGTQIGSTGWYCIYNGTGSSVTVTGLTPGTAYIIMVCEYNGDPNTEKYLTTTETGNPANQTTNTIMINEIDSDTPGTDSEEFIELYDGGIGSISLDGLIIVNFNGSDDQSYDAYDLDGYSTDANGYFVLGSVNVAESDLNFTSATNQIQNGADAVALYFGDDTDFPDDTPITTANLIDAVVYDTNDATDTGLAPLLTVGSQLNEDERGDQEHHSLQRIPNGSGGLRDSTTFKAEIPTPGEANVALPIISVEGNTNIITNGANSPNVTNHTVLPNVAVDAGTSSRTYTIKNDGIGELTIYSVTITGTNNGDFAVSTPPPSSIAANSSATFTVTFNPSAGGARLATVNINNNDADMSPYTFDIEGNGIDIAAPSTQAHSIVFSNMGAASFTISWTRGNGDSCAVFIIKDNSGNALPENDKSYIENSGFGKGEQIGTTSWYCVFKGIGTSIGITGLTPGSTYRVMVCEYNEDSGFIRYNKNLTIEYNPVNQTTNSILINEVDADTPGSDEMEFIELYDGGVGNTILDGLVLVAFNGSSDESYKSYDLDGETTDANGYFVIGNSAVSGVDLIIGDGSIQNGADAISLYVGDDTDFPNGTAITTTNLIDAIVYDNGQIDDAGLLALLNGGEPQVNEDGNGDVQNHSMQRIQNGTGGLRNTTSYEQSIPTPDAENYAFPEILNATYNYNTNTLTVTCLFLVANPGGANDVDISLLTFTGEGGSTYTLTSINDVEITSSTEFSVILTGTDLINVEYLLNKNGTESATSGTDYNLSAADNWLTGAPASKDINTDICEITVSDFANPVITLTTYNAATGGLVATGTDFVANLGATNDIDASLFTFKGQGGNTYTLTNTSDVEVTSATEFTLILSAIDKLNVNGLLNKNGTEAGDATVYNLSAADNWLAGSPAGNNIADATTPIDVSNVAVPLINSAEYNYLTNILTVTGTGFTANPGTGNDIDVSKLTIEGSDYTLSTSADVEVTSETQFSVTITGNDLPNVESILNNNGTTSAGGTDYNLAAADNWLAAADPSADISDLTGNQIDVSNYSNPAITFANYDASTGALVVTGTNLVSNSGANNDIDASTLTITGEGGNTYQLNDTPDTDLTSATEFTLTLSATDRLNVNGLLNRNGLSSSDGTSYNLAAADNWDTGAPSGNDIADLTGNAIDVSNVQVPTITNAFYDSDLGVLTVTCTNLFRKPGLENDIDVSKLSITGEGSTYTLSAALSDVEISSSTEFSVTITGTDKTQVDLRLDLFGTQSSGGTDYNLGAAEDWLTTADPDTDIADLTSNGIEVYIPPKIENADYNAATGVLVVAGSNIRENGGGSDIDASKFTITGEGGDTYTLTNTPDVNRTNSSEFTLTLSTTDKAAINTILNKNGTTSTSGTDYNLAAADDWCTNQTDGNTEDLLLNEIDVSNIPNPEIIDSDYDVVTSQLVVTCTNLVKKAGATNDIDASLFTITGEGDLTYTLTNTPDVEITSGTQFTLSLSDDDKAEVNQILNKNGTTSTSGTVYNLAAADDWVTGAGPAINIEDLLNNEIDVSNVPVPVIVNSEYNWLEGELTATGTGFLKFAGAANDIDASKFTFTGEAGATYTLIGTPDVEITSGSEFTLTLDATDKAAVNLLLNEEGVESADNTLYNLAATEDWATGADPAINIADATTVITAFNFNTPPTGRDSSITSFNNDVFYFAETNFPFNDVDGDNFAGIRIESIETDGELKYNGVDVTSGLDCPDISLLSFNPENDETGSPYAEFEFKVIDDRGGYSDETYTMTVTVIGLYTYVTDVSCYRENDGSITVEVINGTPNFTYSWSTGIDSTTSSAIYVLNELIADTYTLTFSDGAGAAKTLDITVSEPTELEVNIIDRRDIVCTDDDNGFITIGINGGTLPYSILWSNKKTTTKIAGLRRGIYEAIVTDANGCTTSVKDTIKAIDNIPPVAICKDTTLYLDNSGYSRIYPLDICGESIDNCEIISWMISRSIFTCDNLGSNEVSVWISDKQDNFDECFATVTVVDTITPVIICHDTTLYLDASGEAILNTEEILDAWDNCSFTVEPSLLSFDCSDISQEGGEIIVPWINEFHYDNTGTDQDEFIEIAGPAGTSLEGYSISLYNGNNNQVYGTINLEGIIPDEGNGFGAIAFDAQGLQNGPADGIALVAPDLSVLEFISYEGQLTAEDGPAIGIVSTPVGVEESGDTPIGASIYLANGFVWEVALVSSPGLLNPDQLLPEDEEAIEIVATDLSGNSSSCHINVTVLDTTSPVALCNDISIPLNENNEAVVTVEMIDAGSFDNCEIARIELNQSTFSCTHIGVNQIVLTVEDLSGNISTCEANVEILDTVPPTAICEDTTLYLDSDGIVSILPGDIGSLSFDNCGISLMELSKSVFNCDDIGINQVTLIVEDMNGLTSECLATVTIVDTMPPVMLCHDTTIYLDESGEVSLNIEEFLDAYDNCSDIVIEPAILSFDCNDISHESGGIILPWINEFHYDNSDADQGEFIEVAGPAGTSLEGYSISLYNGNNNLVYNTINLEGIIPDEGNGFGALAFDATGLQNGPADGIALVAPDLSVLEFISYEGQLTAEDGPAAGIASISVGVEESGDTPPEASIHLTDNFVWEVALVSSPGLLNPGQPQPDINEAIEITATDLSGNSSSCNINITVLDTIPPVALCSDITLPVDINGLIKLTPEMFDNGSFDNCGIAEMSIFPEVLSCADAGENTVTLTVKDFSGNESSCLASFWHEDYFPPEGICLEVAAGLDENGEAYITPEMVDNGSFDNCGIAGMELSQSVFSCEDIGINQVTLTIEDINGLTSECLTKVTIFDNINPVVEYVEDLTFYTEPGECETGITYPEIIFTDNCSATITQINGLGPDGVFPVGTTTEEYLITDSSGNTVTLSFDIIIVSPNLPPTIDPVPDVEVDEDSEISIILTGISDGGSCTPQDIDITAISEKSPVITDLSVNYIQGNSTAELTARLLPDWNGNTSIIVTVTDSEGEETSETINITVIPINDPPYVLNPISDSEVHAGHILKIPVLPFKGGVFDDPDVDDILEIEVTTEDGNDIPDFILFSSDTIYISPVIQDTGLVSLIAIASDIEGATASDTFLIKVLDYETLSGITENNLNIKLYPNPTKGNLTLEIIDSENNTANVIIYTSRGEMIFQEKDIPKIFKIDMASFASGVYFMKINLNNKEYTRQFILNREKDN